MWGIMRRLTRQEREEFIKEANEHGWIDAEIARQIGTDRRNLHQIVQRDSPRSPFIPVLDKWLRENKNKFAAEVLRGEQFEALDEIEKVLRGLISHAGRRDLPVEKRIESIVEGIAVLLEEIPDGQQLLSQVLERIRG